MIYHKVLVNQTRFSKSLIVGDGTTHDVKVAPDLIDCLNLEETEILCADKGYDSELFI